MWSMARARARGRSAILHFCETSSVKGVPKIVRSRTPAQRVLWTFTVLLGSVTATYQVYYMMVHYLAYSTTISMAQVRDRVAFPDVTVCNLNVLWSQEGEDGIGPNFSFDQYVDIVNEEHVKYEKTGKPEAAYLMHLWSLVGYLQYFAKNDTRHLQRKMILDCFWDMDLWGGGYAAPCLEQVTSYFSHEHGPCFTFALDEATASEAYSFTTLLYLNDFTEEAIHGFPISSSLTYAKGMRVVIHPPGTVPDMSRGFNIAPGHETTVRMRGRRREMLREPYGECTTNDRILDCDFMSQDFAWNQSRNYHYTTHLCEHLCRQQLVIDYCGCVDMQTIALPEQRAKYPSCGVLNLDNVSDTITMLECATVAVIEAEDPGACVCLDPCKSFDYETATHQVPWPHENFQLAFYKRYVNTSDTLGRFKVYEDILAQMATNKSEAFKKLRETDLLRRNYLQLNIVFESKETTELKDKPAISPEALFGNLGGILNLWIGVTFITIIELLDLVIMLIFGSGAEEKKEQDGLSAEQQVPLSATLANTHFNGNYSEQSNNTWASYETPT